MTKVNLITKDARNILQMTNMKNPTSSIFNALKSSFICFFHCFCFSFKCTCVHVLVQANEGAQRSQRQWLS